MNKSILLIGFGSIAKKYFTILSQKKLRVFCYTKNLNQKFPNNLKIIKSLKSLSFINYAVICTPPNQHLYYANLLIKQKIPVLIEKPLTDEFNKNIRSLLNLAKQNNTFFMVGYNLRFLPINNLIKSYLDTKKLGKILSAAIYVGQYLPHWRKNQKYWESYSSSYARGGGVALDLIHEIDLGFFWFNNLTKYKIYSDKLSDLDIDCEDFVQINFKDAANIQITLDYLNHIKTRKYMIIGSKGSIICDIYQKYFEFKSIDEKSIKITKSSQFDVNQTFIDQLNFFFKAEKNKSLGLLNDRFLGIDALKIALKARKYVPRI